MQALKSIGAVTAGFLTIVILSSGTDAVLERVGFFSTERAAYTVPMFLVSIVYRAIFAVLGGFVAGKLAPRKPMRHVLALAMIGTLIGVAGVVAGWNLPGYPHWYAITLTALTLPAIWCGGKLAISGKGEKVSGKI